MEFLYPISKELLRVLLIRAIGADYLGAGSSPAPFSAEHPPPAAHPFTGMISVPPSPPFEVEWVCMAMPPTGIVDALALAFGPPSAVATALATHEVVVGGGSWRRQRSPA